MNDTSRLKQIETEIEEEYKECMEDYKTRWKTGDEVTREEIKSRFDALRQKAQDFGINRTKYLEIVDRANGRVK